MGHALPPWDGVAMCLRRTKDLEVLLRILELLRVTTVLTNGGTHHSAQDKLIRLCRLQVLEYSLGFLELALFEPPCASDA